MSLPSISRLVLAQNAIGLAVPAGPAVASMFSYRQLRRRGTDDSAAAWVVAASNVIGMLALATFGAFTTTGTSLLTIAVALLLIVALTVLVLLARSPQRLLRPTIRLVNLRDRFRRHAPASSAETRAAQQLDRLGVVQVSWSDWVFIAVFALAAVAADCAVWVSSSRAMITLPARCAAGNLTGRAAQTCANFHQPTLAALFVAYAAGQLALAVPFLPGGIGLVESFMTTALTAAKTRAIPALSAVLIYRLIDFWAVLAIGGLLLLTLRRSNHKHPDRISSATES